ncbi:MAG: hypothetical protein ACKVUS_04265 [Saprospiraceae bacterium]
MFKPAALLASLFLISCNSPETRLDRLQHRFWEKFARQDFFEIRLENEVLHLPLPLAASPPEEQKTLALSLRKEAHSIEKEKLGTESQKQLAQLCAALDDLAASSGNPFFDPSRCAISQHLRQYSERAGLLLFLEKIPAYYAEVERRWQTPDGRFVPKAVAESQTALDLLNAVEEKSEGEISARARAARAAVKDFIGLCQSAFLGAGVK